MEIGRVTGGVATEGGRAEKKGETERDLGRAIADALRATQAKREERKDRFISRQLEEQLKSANGQAEAAGEQLKVQLRCHKIASHVMAGDKVDPKDLRYLMEHDPKGYQLAMAMRRPKEDPEKVKRITEDEKQKSEAAQAGESLPAEGAAEAAPPADGGADAPAE